MVLHRSEKPAGPHSLIFTLLFVASVILAYYIASLSFGVGCSGIIAFLFPLLCAFPVSAGLSNILHRKLKNSWLRIPLPLLVFPLLFGLLFSYIMFYERNPQHMFRVFVADPIPAGVTDIRARYINDGIYQDVLVSFRASPEVVRSIVKEQQLEKLDGNFFSNHPDSNLPEASWGTNWTAYARTLYKQSGAVTGYIKLWVETDQSLVVFRKVVE